MSLERTLLFFLYATVLWAFGALAYFAHLHTPAILLFLGAFVLRLFKDQLGLRLSPLFWLGASGLVLAGSFYGWFVLYERLYTVVYLFLYLQINKVWTWEKNRDLLQIFGLSFFHMLAAAVSTQALLFAPVMLGYLFLVLGGLITLTLKKDAERAILTSRRDRQKEEDPFAPATVQSGNRARLSEVLARPYLSRSFLGSVTGVLVLILLAGTLIFYTIPRLETRSITPPFASAPSAPRSASGFSDSVELSHSQQVVLDPTVAMRAYPLTGYEFQGGYPRIGIMRLRASTVDHYNGRRWTRGHTFGRRSSSGRIASRNIVFEERREPLPHEREQETAIIMEPHISSYLFAPEGARRLEVSLHNATFHVDDENHSVRFADGRQPTRQVRYLTRNVAANRPIGLNELMVAHEGPDREEASATPAVMSGQRLRGESAGARVLDSLFRLWNPTVSGLNPDRLPRELEEVYLQLPDHPDSVTVSRLAAEWTGDLDNPLEIAKEIELALKRNYGYSLRIPFSGRSDHLSYFLTEAKSAHCEYFATAMTLMLRARGIPARMVTGYASDEWVHGEPGHFVVRQEHAHTWVEAHVIGMGWVSFDPTPNVGIGSGRIPDTWARRFSRMMDNLRLAWYGAVIDFDSQSQERVYQTVFASIGGLPSPGDMLARSPRETERRSPILLAVLSFAGAGALGLLLLRELRARLRPTIRGGSAAMLGAAPQDRRIEDYLRLLHEVEKQVERTPSETPMEFARKIALRNGPLSEEFAGITETYYTARFDGATWGVGDSQRANALLRRLRESTDHSRGRPARKA